MVLLTVLRKIQRKEKQARVLILGLDNAGKSTLVARALQRPLDEVTPTLGFQIHTLEYGGLHLNLWDVGGQKSIRPFWHNYFEKTDFLVWVVDATALDRLESAREELVATLQEEEDRLVGAGLLIWLNKIEARPDIDLAEVERALGLDEIKNHHTCLVLPCSAFTGQGVTEGLEYIAQEIKERLYR